MRLDALDTLPGGLLVDRVVTGDPATAEAFTARTLAAGHDGVMVMRLDAPYDAGLRGAAWLEVKPVQPSTWWCSPSSGDRAGGRVGSPTSISGRATRTAGS